MFWPSTSENIPEKPRRIALPSCPDPCKVCGGESTGYHYEVASCNGCKSFFRRTIMTKTEWKCIFKNDCPVPKQLHKRQKRRQCGACRFRRCVEVGMNPQGIVTGSDNNNTGLWNGEIQPYRFSRAIASRDARAMNALDNVLHSECRLEYLRKSTLNFRPDCGVTIDSLLNQFTPMGSSFPEMPALINCRVSPMSIEYHLDNRIPLPLVDYDRFPSNFKFWFYMDMVYQISWIASFEFFKSLERADQISLVKLVTLQLIVLTGSYFSFVNKSSRCVYPDGSYLLWDSGCMRGVIANCFDIALEREEYSLLKILLLSNPTWDQLSPAAREVLSSVQKAYSNLLLDYCMRRHGSRGPARMATLIQFHNTVIEKAAKARASIEVMTILKLRSCREILFDQVCDVEML